MGVRPSDATRGKTIFRSSPRLAPATTDQDRATGPGVVRPAGRLRSASPRLGCARSWPRPWCLSAGRDAGPHLASARPLDVRGRVAFSPDIVDQAVSGLWRAQPLHPARSLSPSRQGRHPERSQPAPPVAVALPPLTVRAGHRVSLARRGALLPDHRLCEEQRPAVAGNRFHPVSADRISGNLPAAYPEFAWRSAADRCAAAKSCGGVPPCCSDTRL